MLRGVDTRGRGLLPEVFDSHKRCLTYLAKNSLNLHCFPTGARQEAPTPRYPFMAALTSSAKHSLARAREVNPKTPNPKP